MIEGIVSSLFLIIYVYLFFTKTVVTAKLFASGSFISFIIFFLDKMLRNSKNSEFTN